MTAGVQLAFVTDPRRDVLTPAEVAAVEARVADDDVRRAIHARPARSCRCARPWPMTTDRRCVKCGCRTTTGGP